MNIETVKQGKTVIEQDGQEWLVMPPDGQVHVVYSKARAESIAKTWYRRQLGRGLKIGLGEIEWRNA